MKKETTTEEMKKVEKFDYKIIKTQFIFSTFAFIGICFLNSIDGLIIFFLSGFSCILIVNSLYRKTIII